MDGLNAGYAAVLLDEYLENPGAVPEEWRKLFEQAGSELLAAGHPGLARLLAAAEPSAGRPATAAAATSRCSRRPVDEELLGGVAAAMALVKAYRMHGHLAARLDPLGSEPMGDPALDRDALDPAADARAAGADPRLGCCASTSPGETLARRAAAAARDLLRHDRLRDRAHLRPRRARLAARGDRVGPLPRSRSTPEERRALLERLTEVEGFERYLRRAFLGQKQFSIEGLDVLVPMLDEAIELAADGGAHEVVIGMAHRGRLNVLAHIVGRPYESILREFEGERTIDARRRRSRGRHRRRQVPPRRRRAPRRPPAGEIDGHARAEPEPPRGGRPGRRGPRARRADRPLDAAPALARPDRRAADPDPRRRGVRRPGRRRRDAQPAAPRRLLDRRHAAPDREQPGRLHDRPDRGRARRATRATSPRASTSRSSTSTPTTPRPRSPPIRLALAYRARVRPRRRRSTSSATAASATTSRTRPPTRSR